MNDETTLAELFLGVATSKQREAGDIGRRLSRSKRWRRKRQDAHALRGDLLGSSQQEVQGMTKYLPSLTPKRQLKRWKIRFYRL